MSIVRTDKWLLNSHDKPVEICGRIKEQFDGATAHEIYDHLKRFGMYRLPFNNGHDRIKKLQKNNSWQIVNDEQRILQKLWDGPNVPIYIFPSDSSNKKMKREQNGKSGLAFEDKLFLFISEDTKEKELRALFTHEYNHVCRLSNYHKHERNYVLLDTIILEGLAENAVRDRFGEDLLATWTSYHSIEKLQKLWSNLIFPHRNTPKSSFKHQELLYGSQLHPNMTGYSVGYYLVNKFMQENNITFKELIIMETEEIAQVKDSSKRKK
ncbi:DUF2268 domain-containing protein [Virgibacillus sp. DJP39]|uniref:DUF2268 domain-containing protein n=1 Tax=Virgibacillus sp. DJP39 TaxID=3409790 RepID=UPI003BB7D0C0